MRGWILFIFEDICILSVSEYFRMLRLLAFIFVLLPLEKRLALPGGQNRQSKQCFPKQSAWRHFFCRCSRGLSFKENFTTNIHRISISSSAIKGNFHSQHHSVTTVAVALNCYNISMQLTQQTNR